MFCGSPPDSAKIHRRRAEKPSNRPHAKSVFGRKLRLVDTDQRPQATAGQSLLHENRRWRTACASRA